MSPRGYWYALESLERAQEIVAYHWHPEGPSHAVIPHLHMGPAAFTGSSLLARKHLPTDHVSLERVLGFAITELGVRPLRQNWVELLEHNHEAFVEQWRTGPSVRRS